MLFGVNKLVGLGHWGLIMQKHAKMWSYDGVITVISLNLYFFRVLFLDYFAWVINLLLSNRNHIHFMLVGKHEGWYIFDQQCLIWLALFDTFWKFIFSLNRAKKWFNSKYNSKQNPKYSFKKIFIQNKIQNIHSKKYSFNRVQNIQ